MTNINLQRINAAWGLICTNFPNHTKKEQAQLFFLTHRVSEVEVGTPVLPKYAFALLEVTRRESGVGRETLRTMSLRWRKRTFLYRETAMAELQSNSNEDRS